MVRQTQHDDGDRGDPAAIAPDERGPLQVLWARRGFRDLLIGQAISGLGDWMGTVALMVLVLDLSGSSTAVGGVLVLRLAPAAFAGPLVGKLSRRWDRKTTMLGADAVRAAIVAAIPLVPTLWWVYGCAFAVEVASLVFLPSRDSAIPDLVGDEHLPLANGLVLGSSYGTIPLGAAAVALVSALTHSTSVAFWIDAGTFVASFALIARIADLTTTAPSVGDGEVELGFRQSFRIPLVRSVAPLAMFVSFGLGALFSIGIVFVREVLGATTVEFATLVALFGVGAGVGLAVLHLSGLEPSLRAVCGMVTAQGAVVAAMSLSPVVGLADVGAVLFGAATAATLSTAMSLLQTSLDDRERLMAFNAFHAVIRLGIGGAAIGAGIAADVVSDVRWPLVGTIEPARVVLVSSGLLVVVVGALGLVRTVSAPVGPAP